VPQRRAMHAGLAKIYFVFAKLACFIGSVEIDTIEI
jgi:hypothetical protein